MAKDKETAARAEDVQKERHARITKLIKTLEAGADKDDDKFRRVEKLDTERLKLAKKEEKFDDLGQKLWKSTFGGLFSGMGGAVPESVKVLGRMVGVAFGAKGRIKKKKQKLLQKAYKRAEAIGLDTAGWEDKAPEALEEIVENAEILHEIKMPEEPKGELPALNSMAALLGQRKTDAEIMGGAGGAGSVGGEGAFASGMGGLSEAANKAIIDLSDAALSEGSIFVHDAKMLMMNETWQKEQEARTDTPGQKKEKEQKADAKDKKSQDNWLELFKILKGSGVDGKGGGKEGGGKFGGLMKGILNPVTAASMLAGAAIIGNPAAILLFLGAGSAIGGFIGALLTTMGVGIAILGASLIALGAGLSGLSKGMKDLPEAIKGFETIDGEKLAQAITGMDGLFGALVGFGVGGLISKLADTEKLEAIPDVLKKFETIDGPALTKAGKGMKELSFGLAAMGVASVISAVGSFVGGGLSKLGELMGIKGPIAMLEEFSAAEIDSAKVKLNAEAMIAFGKAMEGAPTVSGTVVGGLFGAIVSAFGGKVVMPWEQVTAFGLLKLDTAQIKLNAEGLVAFSTAMESMPAKVEGEREGGVFASIAAFFSGDIKMPWDQVKKFADADLGNLDQIKDNTEKLKAFGVAMQYMPPEPEGLSLSIPDFGAILKNIKAKFTGGIAEILSNIPKWALPAAAEDWLAANRDPKEVAKEQVVEAQERVTGIEAQKTDVRSAAETQRAGISGAAQTQRGALTSNVARLEALLLKATQKELSGGILGIGDYTQEEKDADVKKAAIAVSQAKTFTGTEIAGINERERVELEKVSVDEEAKISGLNEEQLAEEAKIAEATAVLQDVKIGTKSSLGTTLVDVSGKPIDMSTFAGRNKFFKQADWGDWLKQWGPEGAEKLKEMVEREQEAANEWNVEREENIAKYTEMAKGMTVDEAKRLMMDKNATVEEGKAYAAELAEDWKSSEKEDASGQTEAKKQFLDYVYGINISAKDRVTTMGGDDSFKESAMSSVKVIDALGNLITANMGMTTLGGAGGDLISTTSGSGQQTYAARMMGSAGKGAPALTPDPSQSGGGVNIINSGNSTASSTSTSVSNKQDKPWALAPTSLNQWSPRGRQF